MTFLETIIFLLSKSVKNNDQNVSGGKRQGKVYGIVTPVFGSIKLSLRKKTLDPNLLAELFYEILSLFGAIAR